MFEGQRFAILAMFFVHFHTAYCTLHTEHFTLYTAHFTLQSAHSTIHTPQCTLHTPHSTLITKLICGHKKCWIWPLHGSTLGGHRPFMGNHTICVQSAPGGQGPNAFYQMIRKESRLVVFLLEWLTAEIQFSWWFIGHWVAHSRAVENKRAERRFISNGNFDRRRFLGNKWISGVINRPGVAGAVLQTPW